MSCERIMFVAVLLSYRTVVDSPRDVSSCPRDRDTRDHRQWSSDVTVLASGAEHDRDLMASSNCRLLTEPRRRNGQMRPSLLTDRQTQWDITVMMTTMMMMMMITLAVASRSPASRGSIPS